MTQCDIHDFIFIFSFLLLFVAVFRGYLEAEQLCAALNANETQRFVVQTEVFPDL